MNLYVIRHPSDRLRLAAIVGHWTREEALGLCRRDDPCWDECDVNDVELQAPEKGIARGTIPFVRFMALQSLGLWLDGRPIAPERIP